MGGAIVDPLPALEAIRKSWCDVDLELVLQAVRDNKSEIRESITDALLQSRASDASSDMVPVLRAITELRASDIEQLKSQMRECTAKLDTVASAASRADTRHHMDHGMYGPQYSEHVLGQMMPANVQCMQARPPGHAPAPLPPHARA